MKVLFSVQSPCNISTETYNKILLFAIFYHSLILFKADEIHKQIHQTIKEWKWRRYMLDVLIVATERMKETQILFQIEKSNDRKKRTWNINACRFQWAKDDRSKKSKMIHRRWSCELIEFVRLWRSEWCFGGADIWAIPFSFWSLCFHSLVNWTRWLHESSLGFAGALDMKGRRREIVNSQSMI